MNQSVTNNSQSSNDILDYDVWRLLGLDLNEVQSEKFQNALSEKIFVDFIDRDLIELVGQESFDALTKDAEENDENLNLLVENISNELEKVSKDFNTEIENAARKTSEEFIQSQIEFASKKVSEMQEPQKTEKAKIIENLKKSFSEKNWAEMEALFKGLEVIPQNPKSLVTHL